MYVKRVQGLYTEEPGAGNAQRAAYKRGIDALIEQRKAQLRPSRDAFARQLRQRPEAAREELRRLLGWPLTAGVGPVLNVREECLHRDADAYVGRVQLEVLAGLWFYGIVMRHMDGARRPLVIAQHGGAGTPEVCASFTDSTNYNDMALRLFHKGVDVFAPQLLLWGEDAGRMDCENELRRLDGSIAALEIYCLQRGMDHFEGQPWFGGSFGMVGMSYGGFYALYTAACDTRIKATLVCSMFSDRHACFGTDFSWRDCYRHFGDAQVGALVYPRALRIEWGDADPGKWVVGAQDESVRLRRFYTGAPDNLSFNTFDGTHEFCPEDEGLDWTLARLRVAST